MSKFNVKTVRTAVNSPIRADNTPTGVTHEGAPGYARDPKSELFLLAVTNMVGENTFYEHADDHDNRYAQLVAQVAATDPDWTHRFLTWLRTEANMRSASLVGGLEAARAMKDAGVPGGRRIVDAVLQRADEPGEALAYWTSRYGRRIPKPVKRGVADAARRLYTEKALLKHDTGTHAWRFGDVLEVTHPSTDPDKAMCQGELFAHAIDRRHGNDDEVSPELATINTNRTLRRYATENPEVLLDPDRTRRAGMTWEDVLSLAGSRVDKKHLWEAVIPSMGYMALLRNLRNFDQAGVPDAVAATVAARLSDPDEVARSRQLPMRFLSAYRAAPSLRWGHALEKALEASLINITPLEGRTLILVDTSGSMRAPFSKDGTLERWDAAALFGLALAARCHHADVVAFSQATMKFQTVLGESVLKSLDRWRQGGYFMGSGTNTADAVRLRYKDHDRVVILTDEQASWSLHGRDVTAPVPKHRMVYTWNLAGYRHGHSPSGTGTRHTFGGLTDQAFKMIPLIERGHDAEWPF